MMARGSGEGKSRAKVKDQDEVYVKQEVKNDESILLLAPRLSVEVR